MYLLRARTLVCIDGKESCVTYLLFFIFYKDLLCIVCIIYYYGYNILFLRMVVGSMDTAVFSCSD